MKTLQKLAPRFIIYLILNFLTNTSKPIYYALLLTVSHEIAERLFNKYVENDTSES